MILVLTISSAYDHSENMNCSNQPSSEPIGLPGLRRLRRLYRGVGLSQQELGEQVGLTAQTIGMLERGQVGFMSTTLNRLMAFFNCSADDLLNPREEKKNEHDTQAPDREAPNLDQSIEQN